MPPLAHPEGPLGRLADLAARKATGELALQGADAELRVYLHEGRIAWATDSRNPRAFVRYLEDHASVDGARLKSVLNECHRTRAPLAQALVAARVASAAQVRAALRQQVEPVLAALERCDPVSTPVFLPRPSDSRVDAELTLDLRSALPGTAAGPAVAREEGLDESSFAGVSQGVTLALPPIVPSAAMRPPAPNPPPEPPSPRAGAPHPPSRVPAAPRRSSARVAVVATVIAALAIAAGALVAHGRGIRAPATAAARKGTGPSAEEGVASAASTAPVAFGILSPPSGPAGARGRSMRTGIQAAFAEANASGGIGGRKIELLALDGADDPAEAERVTSDLERNKVVAVVGPVSATALPPAARKRVVLFGAPASPNDPYVFTFRPGTSEETAAAVRYLLEVRRLEPSQLAVFAQDDELGRAGLAGVEEELRRQGHDSSAILRTTCARSGADVSSAVGVIRGEQSRLRAVVVIASSEPAIQLVKRLRGLGARLIFTNVSAVGSRALAEGLAVEAAGPPDDVIVTQVVPLPTSKATAALQYQSALQKHAAGEKPGFIGFEGYIVAKLLLEGVRKAGSDLTADSLAAALEQLHDLDLGLGAAVGFSATDHQASHQVWGTMLQHDGSYKSIRLE